MSLATREQKAVVTDFCACRALWFFHAMKERIKIRLNKEKLTGHRKLYSKLEKPCKQASTQTIKSKQFVYFVLQLLTQQRTGVTAHYPIGRDKEDCGD